MSLMYLQSKLMFLQHGIIKHLSLAFKYICSSCIRDSKRLLHFHTQTSLVLIHKLKVLLVIFVGMFLNPSIFLIAVFWQTVATASSVGGHCGINSSNITSRI